MLTKEFFDSQKWRQLLTNSAKVNSVPAPMVEITLIDGSSFNIRGLAGYRSCAAVEVFGENGEILLRLIPYENIEYVTFKKATAQLFKLEK